jgi:hypothetical protein
MISLKCFYLWSTVYIKSFKMQILCSVNTHISTTTENTHLLQITDFFWSYLNILKNAQYRLSWNKTFVHLNLKTKVYKLHYKTHFIQLAWTYHILYNYIGYNKSQRKLDHHPYLQKNTYRTRFILQHYAKISTFIK